MKKGEKTVKKTSRKERIVDFLTNNPGTHKTSEIAEALDLSVSNVSNVLGVLTREGRITKITGGTYSGNDNGNPSVSQQTVRKNIRELREAEANGETINILLNTYDIVLASYQSWIIKNIDKDIDFEKQLLFIENFKWLTAIADKLMKRWSLVHVGYDTNSRQAQEDAKAKTEAKQKAALKDAPVEEQVTVLGSFDLETKQLIDNFPTLEELSEEDEKEITV